MKLKRYGQFVKGINEKESPKYDTIDDFRKQMDEFDGEYDKSEEEGDLTNTTMSARGQRMVSSPDRFGADDDFATYGDYEDDSYNGFEDEDDDFGDGLGVDHKGMLRGNLTDDGLDSEYDDESDTDYDDDFGDEDLGDEDLDMEEPYMGGEDMPEDGVSAQDTKKPIDKVNVEDNPVMKIYDLAKMLGVEVINGNHLMYGDKMVNFYSETGDLHIGRNRYSTAEKALAALTSGQVQAEEDEEAPAPAPSKAANESRSYRFRNFRK